MDPRVPMPLLLGPEIGPLNLGRWEGDSSSSWAFNSGGPATATLLCFLLSLFCPRQQTAMGCVAYPANNLFTWFACVHLIVPLGFTDVCKYVLRAIYWHELYR